MRLKQRYITEFVQVFLGRCFNTWRKSINRYIDWSIEKLNIVSRLWHIESPFMLTLIFSVELINNHLRRDHKAVEWDQGK